MRFHVVFILSFYLKSILTVVYFVIHLHGAMYFPIHSLVDVLFFKFFKNEENLKKNTSTSGCIEKYISLVKMYKKIRNRKIESKKKIIRNIDSSIR